MLNKPVIIYGAGYRGGREFIRISEENIHVAAFCDNAAEEKRHYYGAPVFLLDEIVKEKNYSNLPFIIGIDDRNVCEKVLGILRKHGLEAYTSFFEYYLGGKADVEIETNTCGGIDGYGSYSILDKVFPDKNRVAYTFGIGRDCSFEEELINKYDFEIYSFDPTPSSEIFIKESGVQCKYSTKFHFYRYAISDKDGTKAFRKNKDCGTYSEDVTPWTMKETDTCTVYRLKTLMSKFGHSKLDLLKLDVEGSEFHAIPDILSSDLQIDQICIEVHSRMYEDSVEKSQEFRKLMNKNGYKLLQGESVRDFLFVHESLI